jgi:hypothetical protein
MGYEVALHFFLKEESSLETSFLWIRGCVLLDEGIWQHDTSPSLAEGFWTLLNMCLGRQMIGTVGRDKPLRFSLVNCEGINLRPFAFSVRHTVFIVHHGPNKSTFGAESCYPIDGLNTERLTGKMGQIEHTCILLHTNVNYFFLDKNKADVTIFTEA